MNKIPKVINYCWFGGNPKSKLIKKCIKSWKKMCPNYEIVEWNESNFDVSSNPYIKEAYDAKKWAFVSDYARLFIIYNNGGIYLDTDVELIKPLDDLISYDSFFALESDQYVNTGLGFGACEKNQIIKNMLDDYEGIHFKNSDGSLDLTGCPVRNTNSIKDIFDRMVDKTQKYVFDNNAFLSKDYFSPYDPSTGVLKKTPNTLGIHWYNASWRNKRVNVKRALLRPIKRIIGKNNFDRIKKTVKK